MDLVKKYFPDIDNEKLSKLNYFSNLICEWNSKINLISRKDISNLEIHHILHSLSILKFFNFPKGVEIIDVGTGGGFPGIPLSIMLPEIKFTLIDSIKKKTEVLKNIVEELKLSNCEINCIRSENLKKQFDFVIGRAVSNLGDFIKLTKHLLKDSKKLVDENLQTGIIYLKGGDLKEELKNIKANIDVFNIEDIFNEDFFKEKYILYIKNLK